VEQAQAAEVQASGDLVAAQAALKVMGVTDPDTLICRKIYLNFHGLCLLNPRDGDTPVPTNSTFGIWLAYSGEMASNPPQAAAESKNRFCVIVPGRRGA
jgi:hypothetical protein